MNKSTKVLKLLNKIHSQLDLKNYLNYLEKDKEFLLSINKKISMNQIFKKREFNSIYEFSIYRNFIYSLIRNIKPAVVLETGVLHGLTSAWILKGLEDNKFGKLISIDLPRRDWKKYFGNTPLGPGGDSEFELDSEKPGWVIPDKLTDKWDLYLGPSFEYLNNILENNNNIELFIHDSDHSYDVMKFECEMVQKKFSNINLIIDDHYCNNFYKEFGENYKRKFYEIDDIDDDLKQVKGCVYYPK